MNCSTLCSSRSKAEKRGEREGEAGEKRREKGGPGGPGAGAGGVIEAGGETDGDLVFLLPPPLPPLPGLMVLAED